MRVTPYTGHAGPEASRETRKLGLVALFFFGALFSLAVWREKTISILLFGSFALLGLMFLLIPAPMRPVHAGCIRVVNAMGRTITTLALTLVFYLVITPATWLKRVLGGRPIYSEIDRDASTYWVSRDEPAQSNERFKKSF